MITGDFNMFNFVNKSIVLQHKFKIWKIFDDDKNSTNLYTHYT